MNGEGKVVTIGLHYKPDPFPEHFAKIIRFFEPDFGSVKF
jgi:hypothetical protein